MESVGNHFIIAGVLSSTKKMMLGLLCLFLVARLNDAASLDLGSQPEGVIALTSEVNHVGERYTSEDDSEKHGYIYYGIRYATAERFEESKLNSDHSYLQNGERLKQGHVCPQHPLFLPGLPPRNLSFNEDCLYLDIYVPSVNGPKNQSLPVLLWIHGGAFQNGDKDIYNASHLASAIDVVVVGINYRVFLFGFLSTGDETAKGNYGIGDMKLALEWTKQNIGKYGGDANKISIFGESAGGAAVSALMLDPKVRGSVTAAVAMSGSILGHWANVTNPKASFTALATAAGCPNDTSSEDMVKCLKDLTVDQLLNATAKDMKTTGMTFHFSTVLDGHHILPFQAAQSKRPDSGHEASFISGYLKEDASLLLWLMSPHLFNPNVTVSYTDSVKFVESYLAQFAPCAIQNPAISRKVLDKYGLAETDNRAEVLQKKIKITTDISFAYPSVKEAILYANRSYSGNAPNYLYRISYDPGFQGLGAFHGMDLMHVFGGVMRKLMNITLNDDITKSLREMLRQAAYDGRLASDPVGASLSYIDLGQSGKFQKGVDDLKELVKFWDDVLDLPCVGPGQVQKTSLVS